MPLSTEFSLSLIVFVAIMIGIIGLPELVGTR